MTRRQRRFHALVWTIGGPLLVVALLGLLAARPPLSPEPAPPAEVSP